MRVILFGATGMVGRGVLRECLLDPEVEAVLSLVRAPTAQRHAKLREIVQPDLADLSAIRDHLSGYQACFFCLGMRGMIYTELEVRGARSDLHSGMYGGAAPNPFVSLAQILAKLKDEDGRIRIPGFYDDIIPPSPEELAAWRSLPFDEEEYRVAEVGSRTLVGEAGYSVLERTWARPTLDVHGIQGGFTGAGAKTVIPAKATAKVSMRLVPGMTPAKAFSLYKSYVEKIAPAGVDVEVRLIHSGDPCLIPVDNPYVRAATRALHEVWGKDTVFIRSGGSIPIVGDFARHLGLPSVMMGFGLPDDNLHAPNEKFHLKNFELGIESLIRFLELLDIVDSKAT